MWERKLYYTGKSHYHCQNKALVRWAQLYSHGTDPCAQSHQAWLALTQPRAKHTLGAAVAKLSALGDGAGWQCGGTCRQAVPDGPDRGTCRIPHLQSKSGCTIHLSAPNVAPACGQSRHSVSRNWALSQCCQQERTSASRSMRTLQQRSFQGRLAQFFIYFQRFLLSFVCW